MIIGYGSTGKYVLDMLMRLQDLVNCEYIVVSRTAKEEAEKRINLSLVSSGIFGNYPKISYIECDIMNTDRLSEILSASSPNVIAYTGRYMKGFKYGEYSYPNNIGYGVWTPMAVILVEKVMQAVKNAGIQARVINTSYGDAVSPLLAAKGLAPYTSAGNLNHLIPRIKRAYESITGEQAQNTDVTFVGSHYANTYISKEGTPKGSPYLMKISGNIAVEDCEIFRRCALPTASGQERNVMIASDVVMLVRLMLDKSGNKYKIHVPGPFGLIGGYPLVFCNGEAVIDEQEFSLAEMMTVNQESLRYDGVERLDGNGIHFTDEVIKKMHDIFGLDYPHTLALEDCERFSQKVADVLLHCRH